MVRCRGRGCLARMSFQSEDSPWCSRPDAASYLCYSDAQTIDSKLTNNQRYTPGKIRYRMLNGRVRLWKKDVLAMLPPFED